MLRDEQRAPVARKTDSASVQRSYNTTRRVTVRGCPAAVVLASAARVGHSTSTRTRCAAQAAHEGVRQRAMLRATCIVHRCSVQRAIYTVATCNIHHATLQRAPHRCNVQHTVATCTTPLQRAACAIHQCSGATDSTQRCSVGQPHSLRGRRQGAREGARQGRAQQGRERLLRPLPHGLRRRRWPPVRGRPPPPPRPMPPKPSHDAMLSPELAPPPCAARALRTLVRRVPVVPPLGGRRQRRRRP
jgi:hypothetical protein